MITCWRPVLLHPEASLDELINRLEAAVATGHAEKGTGLVGYPECPNRLHRNKSFKFRVL